MEGLAQRPSRKEREKVWDRAKYLKKKHGVEGEQYKAFVARMRLKGFFFNTSRNGTTNNTNQHKDATNPARRELSTHPAAIRSRKRRLMLRVKALGSASTSNNKVRATTIVII
jgi:hypothetical protein